MARPRVVIIGGGFGGLQAARRLRGHDLAVTLVDRRNHHVFQPLLYQVATAGLSPGDIASPIRWILRRQRNVEVLLDEVVGIDTAAREVSFRDGARCPYDYLIVAAGATHAYFGHDDWRPSAPALKTLEDALAIRRRVLSVFEAAERDSVLANRHPNLTFVIVGGGPTGVELAGALAEIARHTLRHDFRRVDTRAARIILIEAGPAILSTFPAPLREAAWRDLERLGVEVRTGTPVTRIDPGVVEAGGERIEAVSVLWAAGVAASPLGGMLGVPLDRAGRVQVQPDLTIPGHPDVFVIGDLATLAGTDGSPLPGVAQVAIQMGAHAASNVVRAVGGQPLRPFRYRNLGNMATIGRAAAIADLPALQLKGFIGWLAWLFVHILNLIGFRNRLLVMIQWAWAYASYDRAVRLITGVDTDGE
ncbi:MAG TPA: NAD(P)/FAD-dependent oxidoreductase [Vicinamibacterales bacterium]|jgi:NADH dehydrogenase